MIDKLQSSHDAQCPNPQPLPIKSPQNPKAIQRYLFPAEQGVRADYPRLCEPTETRLQAAVQLLLRAHKTKPDERALAQALVRTRDTVQWNNDQQ